MSTDDIRCLANASIILSTAGHTQLALDIVKVTSDELDALMVEKGL